MPLDSLATCRRRVSDRETLFRRSVQATGPVVRGPDNLEGHPGEDAVGTGIPVGQRFRCLEGQQRLGARCENRPGSGTFEGATPRVNAGYCSSVRQHFDGVHFERWHGQYNSTGRRSHGENQRFAESEMETISTRSSLTNNNLFIYLLLEKIQN